MRVNSKTTFDKDECEMLRDILRSYDVRHFIRAHINVDDYLETFDRFLGELEHATSIAVEADYSE